MAKAGGNTIVVAGGGGAGGGSKSGGGESKDGGSSSKTKISNGKLKLDDNTVTMALGGIVAVGVLFHLYNTNPQLFHGFIDPIKNLVSGQPTIPAAPPGTTVNDQIPQDATQLAPSPTQGQWGGQMQYPTYPTSQQQNTGQQPFQTPGQPQYPQQYQGYNPQDQFGGAGGGSDTGGFQTTYNPAFGQNSNVQSFRARGGYDYSSRDGMIRSN